MIAMRKRWRDLKIWVRDDLGWLGFHWKLRGKDKKIEENRMSQIF